MTSMTIFITIGLKKWGGLGIFLISISYAAAFAVIGWKLVQMENYQSTLLYFSHFSCRKYLLRVV